MKKIQKWLSLLLCLAMLISVVPMGALAAETDETEETAETTVPSEEVTEAPSEADATEAPAEEPALPEQITDPAPDADASTQEVADTDVARIGDTGYASLSDAVDAAADGDTIVLLADAEFAAAVTIAKELTITAESAVTMTKTAANEWLLIKAGGNVTLEGPITVVGTSGMYGALIEIAKSGILVMNDGVTLKDNVTSETTIGGAVNIVDGTFIMNGGTISGCALSGSTKAGTTSAGTTGGAIRIKNNKNATVSASFTMNGGTISGCYAYTGGAIGLENLGSTTGAFVVMNGGTITGCYNTNATANYSGGAAVYIYNTLSYGMKSIEGATFTMNGGTITNCGGSKGKYGVINMFTNNKASAYGGHIYILGGSIVNNKVYTGDYSASYGNGIHVERLVANSPVLTIGGSAIIESEIFLKSATTNYFEIRDDFTGSVNVWSQGYNASSSDGNGQMFATSVNAAGESVAATDAIAGRISVLNYTWDGSNYLVDEDGNYVYRYSAYADAENNQYIFGEYFVPAVTHTVTYTDGVEDVEIFADQTYTVVEGEATPAFEGDIVRNGYTFTGWTPEVSETVTADVTYTANWEVAVSGEFNGVTWRADNEGLAVELQKIMALESVQVLVYCDDELLTTVSWRDEYIQKCVYMDYLTASVRTGEEESTQWAATAWTPQDHKVPTKLELYIDGQLMDTLEMELDADTWASQAGTITMPDSPDKYGKNVDPALMTIVCDSDEDHAPVTVSWYSQACKILPSGSVPVWDEELGAWTIGVRMDSIKYYAVYLKFDKAYNGINHTTVDDQPLPAGISNVDTYLIWDAEQELWVPGEEIVIHTTCETAPCAPTLSYLTLQIRVHGDLDGDGVFDDNYTTTIPADAYTVGEVTGNREDGFTVELSVSLANDDIYITTWMTQKGVENYSYIWNMTPQTVTVTLYYTGDLTGTLYGDKNGDWLLVDTDKTFGGIADAYVAANTTVTYTDGMDGAAFEDQIHTVALGDNTPAYDGEPTADGLVFMGWTPEVAETVSGETIYTATWAPAVNKYGYNVQNPLLTIYCDSDEDHEPMTGKWYPQNCAVYPKNSLPVWDETLGTWTIGVRIQSLTIYYVDQIEDDNNNIIHTLVGDSVIVTTLKWDAEQELWVPTEELEVHCTCKTVPDAPVGIGLESYQVKVMGDLDGDGVYGESKVTNDSGIGEVYTTTISPEDMTLGEIYGSREEGFFIDITATLEADDIYLKNWIAQCAPGEAYSYNWDLTEKTITFTLRYAGDLNATLSGSGSSDWVLSTTGNGWGVVGYAYVGTSAVITYTDGIDELEIFADQTCIAAVGDSTPAFDGEPTREGYTFLGWTPEVSDTVTGDATYCAVWAPTIVTQPVDCVVYINDKAYFHVVATGDGLTYQWQYSRNGNTWTDSDLWVAVTDTLTMKATAYRDGLKYRCVITDQYGASVITDVVSLDVLQITITKQPYTLYVTQDSQAKFTVAASGEGLTYQWQYSRNGNTWTNSPLDSAVTSTLTMKATEYRSGMLYRCVITNAAGESITTRVVGLYSTPAINVTKQPVDCTASLDGTMSFSVTVAETDVNYQWQYSEDGGETWQNSPLTAANTSKITMKATQYRSTLVYRCVITDADGNMVITNHVVLILK